MKDKSTYQLPGGEVAVWQYDTSRSSVVVFESVDGSRFVQSVDLSEDLMKDLTNENVAWTIRHVLDGVLTMLQGGEGQQLPSVDGLTPLPEDYEDTDPQEQILERVRGALQAAPMRWHWVSTELLIGLGIDLAEPDTEEDADQLRTLLNKTVSLRDGSGYEVEKHPSLKARWKLPFSQRARRSRPEGK